MGMLAFAIVIISTALAYRRGGTTTAAPGHRRTRSLLAIFVASLVVVLFEARAGFFQQLVNYCVAAAATAIALVPLTAASATLVLLAACRNLTLAQPLWTSSMSVGSWLALLFTLWWLGGVVFLTFYAPFTVTSNPYFGCWAALIASCHLLLQSSKRARDAMTTQHADPASSTNASSTNSTMTYGGLMATRGRRHPLLGLVLASAVLIGASIRHVSDGSGEAAYILGVSILAMLIVGVLLLRPQWVAPRWRTVIALILLLMWVTLVWFATFVGPFVVTGNGAHPSFTFRSGQTHTAALALHPADTVSRAPSRVWQASLARGSV